MNMEKQQETGRTISPEQAERDFAAERLIRFLNTAKMTLPGGAPLQEVLRSRDAIKNFVLSLEYADYARLLIGINAMVRNKSSNDEWKMDDEGVLMGDQNIFPDQADKEELLAKSLAAAKIMSSDGRSTEDIAIQLSVPLTAIHPFIDGNGRAAKFLFTILRAGYDQKMLTEILTGDGYSNLVNAALFQGAATSVLDPAHELVFEKFEAWIALADNRKKVVEVIIDTILNDRDLLYRVEGDSSYLDTFKQSMKEGIDPAVLERLFEQK